MDERPKKPASVRFIERRVERKGLRPRLAAGVIAVVWLAAIVVFGVIEHLVDPESFDSVWLGMWWATQTVTTVGYGDVVPQSADGQLIATVLMVGGLSLFAVITGVITSAFVTRAQVERRASGGDPLMQRLDELATELAATREDLARLAGDGGSAPSQR
jgi:voltage-gated potassium channel